MPQPPRHADFAEWKFVTNYMLAGCEPPYYVLLALSKEPVGDLLMLILGIEAFDIAQAMFDPRKGRRRKPARHGRKRPTTRGIPDLSDMIGERARVDEVAEAVGKFPGARVAFRVLNVVEGISFASAIAEGVTDVAFESLWGMMNITPTHCKEFPRISRRMTDVQTAGGIFPSPDPISMNDLEFNNGFFEGVYGTTCNSSSYGVSVSATIQGANPENDSVGSLVLYDDDGVILGESATVSLAPDQLITLNTSCTQDAGQMIFWGWKHSTGFVRIMNGSVLAFGESGWLDWTKSLG